MAMTAEEKITENDDKIYRKRFVDEVTEPTIDMDWMIRPCRIYKEEYEECKSLRGRLHQYFIFGESIDCNQWEKDHNNCNKWTEEENTKAKLEVIKSECKRKNARLKAHYDNDIWTNKTEPPKDWNKQLPDWLVERNKNTYLANKAEELKGVDNIYTAPMPTKNCTIL